MYHSNGCSSPPSDTKTGEISPKQALLEHACGQLPAGTLVPPPPSGEAAAAGQLIAPVIPPAVGPAHNRSGRCRWPTCLLARPARSVTRGKVYMSVANGSTALQRQRQDQRRRHHCTSSLGPAGIVRLPRLRYRAGTDREGHKCPFTVGCRDSGVRSARRPCHSSRLLPCPGGPARSGPGGRPVPGE